MKCPNCGKEVSQDKNYCEYCGSSLYGPRSIDLNNPGEQSSAFQSGNIKSITGIDINEIAPVDASVKDNEKKEKNQLIKKFKEIINKKDLKKVRISTIVFCLVILVLLVLNIIMFFNNRKLKNFNGSYECNKEITKSCVKAYYGLTNDYAFTIPNNWVYSYTSSGTIITDETTSILLYKFETGQIDRVTSETLKNIYVEAGYTTALVEENILNTRKIIYVRFTAGGLNFVDFYYQYDPEKIVYGQISSSEDIPISATVTGIISSLIIQEKELNISVSKAPLNYENIFSLVK